MPLVSELRKVFAGELQGPVTDTIILNAGAGLYVYDQAESVQAGCQMAAEAIKAGKPLKVMEKWASVSQKC